jgi:hypothetical protein
MKFGHLRNKIIVFCEKTLHLENLDMCTVDSNKKKVLTEEKPSSADLRTPRRANKITALQELGNVYPWILISDFCTLENPGFAVGYAPLFTRERKKSEYRITASTQVPRSRVLF